ncbi:hypothetical protein BM477_04705 [Boudabousia marimammalium]|uniref:Ribosome maturation factor RimP n=2 Tax=Boudabousia marimammalium TaxID=156892 RepID=A0A1Q5PPD5_9ACTO|nr:hypothetical protein BM477_04705 [Boudabousia marimammalium]
MVEKLTITKGKNPLVIVDVDKIDGPGSVPGTLVETASRLISQEMDELDPLPTAYTLEVGTPGAERELITPRHYRRTLGRLVKIKTKTEGRVSGRLIEVTDTQITVEASGKERQIPLESILSARSRVDLSQTEE